MIDTQEMRAKYAAKNGRAPAGAVDVRALCDALDYREGRRACSACANNRVHPFYEPCASCNSDNYAKNWRPHMINWQPIETAPDAQVILYVPPHKLRDAVVFVGRASECSKSATHWAPINLPGETQCKTCKFMERDCYGVLPANGVTCTMWREKT